jgi:oligopeptide transport system substrate-binding protein
MHRMKRALTRRSYLMLSLLGVLAMLLAGCGSNSSGASQLDPAQKFIWPIIGASSINDLVLDPANVADFYSATVTNAIFSGLVTVDHDLNVIPDSATWEVSPDGRQYTFHLKPDLHFSDGTPLGAQDFAYSIDRALSPDVCVAVNGPACVGAPLASVYLGDIKGAADRAAGTLSTVINTTGIFTPDAQTLIIKLDKPVAYFLEALTYPTSFPVEKALIDKYGNDYQNHNDWTTHLTEGGCTGPFEIKSYGDGKTLTLVPNPYWHGPKLTLKEVDRPFVQDPVDAYNNYRHGQYDYTDVPSQEYQSAKDQEDFHEVGLLQTDYIGINQEAKPFDNLNVRQAFALALNKQLIADRVLNGAVLPTNHIVPEGMPGYDDALTAPGSNTRIVTGDTDKAQTLIKSYFSSCKCNGLLEFKFYYPSGNTDRLHTAQAMKNMWETVLSGDWGQVKVDLTEVTFHDLVIAYFPATAGNHKGAFDMSMWMIGWIADYPDPQDWLSLQFAPGSPNNISNYQDGPNNFSAWSLCQQADVEQDPAKRMSLYHQAEQQLVDTVAWLPYAQPKGIWRLKTYIQGYDPSSLNLLSDLAWSNVSVLAH